MYVRWATSDDAHAIMAMAKTGDRTKRLREADTEERTIIAEDAEGIHGWMTLLLGARNIMLLAWGVRCEDRARSLQKQSVAYFLLRHLLAVAKKRKARIWFTLDIDQKKWLNSLVKRVTIHHKPDARVYFVEESV